MKSRNTKPTKGGSHDQKWTPMAVGTNHFSAEYLDQSDPSSGEDVKKERSVGAWGQNKKEIDQSIFFLTFN